MSVISRFGQIAIKIVTVPFLVGGIVLASIVHSWLPQSIKDSFLGWFLLLIVAGIGIAIGGLFAYGIFTFVLAWFVPQSPLLVESEMSDTGAFRRFFEPVFRMVKRLALRLASGLHRT